MRRSLLSIIVVGTVHYYPAFSQEYVPLEGLVAMLPEGGHDEEGDPSHLFFILEGDAARALYAKLPTPAELDPCTDSQVKIMDGIHCYVDECYFTLDMERARLGVNSGWMC